MNADQGTQYEQGHGKRLFLSYAREDRDALRPLEEGIEVLHHQLWVDRKLEAGHTWWNDITEHIRDCDAMLIAVSPALLESEAAASERRYARELGKPLIPVVIASMTDDFLPSDIAGLQFVDFVNDPRAPFHLANVLASLPPAPPLPDPLPVPPPVPTSYMAGLADKIREPALSYDDQMALVGSLRASLAQPKEKATALRLMQQLAERHDLYNRPGKEIDELLQQQRNGAPGKGNNQIAHTPNPPTQQIPAPQLGQNSPFPAQFPDNYPAQAPQQAQRFVPQRAPNWKVNAYSPFQPPDALSSQGPPRRLALSIVALVLTLYPLLGAPGAIGLYFSSQVGTRWSLGDREGAKKASRNATVAATGGIVFFVLFVLYAAASTPV